MKKLNKRKIKWIVKEMDKREIGAWTIAHQQKITPRWAREVAKKYKNCKDPVLLKPRRKPNPITKEEPKKKKVRRYRSYQRKHSLSLEHADWFEHKRQKCIVFIDDASRFITCCKAFKKADSENTIRAFKEALRWGTPKQIHTDHGTQFVANEQEGKKQGKSQFTEFAHSLKIQHIKARVKRPQANGKAERVIQTIKKLWNELRNLEKAVKHYNYKRPHRSLTNGRLRTPYQAFLEKSRKK